MIAAVELFYTPYYLCDALNNLATSVQSLSKKRKVSTRYFEVSIYMCLSEYDFDAMTEVSPPVIFPC